MVESNTLSKAKSTHLQATLKNFGTKFTKWCREETGWLITRVDVTVIAGPNRPGFQAAHADEGGLNVHNYIIALEDICRVEFYDADRDDLAHVVLRCGEFVRFQKEIHLGINIKAPRLHIKVTLL